MSIDVQFTENENSFNVGFGDVTVIHDVPYIDDLLQRDTLILNCGTSSTVV